MIRHFASKSKIEEPVPPPWLKEISRRGIEQTIVFTRTNDLKRVMQLVKENQAGFARTTVKFPPRRFDLYEPIVVEGYGTNEVELDFSGAYFKTHGCSGLDLKGGGPVILRGGFFDFTFADATNIGLIQIDGPQAVITGTSH